MKENTIIPVVINTTVHGLTIKNRPIDNIEATGPTTGSLGIIAAVNACSWPVCLDGVDFPAPD
ncbi:hypothetical protein [Advenella sp. S44]|uniref:hypothetical protein n=1 Tax=Advenella sp. S44 TaxID=1982755 RepID=UPI00128FEC03|nr:hypothetical protein [Advenella sp. S44]